MLSGGRRFLWWNAFSGGGRSVVKDACSGGGRCGKTL